MAGDSERKNRAMPPFHFSDIFSAGTLLIVFGIYRKVSIITYQHGLMWTDFAERKGLISKKAYGASAGSDL
jgi:hypothetical protein